MEMDFTVTQSPARRTSIGSVAAALFFLSAHASANPTPTPQSIEMEIIREGESATLERLYQSDSDWKVVLAGIASGQTPWLTLAKNLYGVADGGASEQIALAAGEALEHRPQDVFAILANV